MTGPSGSAVAEPQPAQSPEEPPGSSGAGRPAAAIAVRDLCVTFESDQQQVEALRDLSLEIGEGELLSVLGPSGCGKSTLLRIIADLIPATAGEVTVLGGEPATARRNRSIGFVFQKAGLLPWRTAMENVRLPLEIGKRRRKDKPADDPAELLELVGLGSRVDAYPHQLSGGMQQRVAIARALVTRPRILLMDEPFGALDEITRETMNKELLRIWRETGTTIVFVTHSIPESVFLSRRIAVLSAHPGRLVGVLDVDLPGQRDYELRDAAEFAEAAAEVRALLHGGAS